MRRNRGNVIPLSRDPQLAEAFGAWHWWGDTDEAASTGGLHLLDWPDPDYPDRMVECGRLMEIRVRMPRQRRSTHITLSDKAANTSHLCFDPDHPAERLYICSSPDARHDTKVLFWDGSNAQPWNLNDLAVEIGHRHGTRDYPHVRVKPVGIATHVVYWTYKKGDDPPSGYVHRLGEEGGEEPALAVDSRGRYWLAGGSYTCPTPGITQ